MLIIDARLECRTPSLRVIDDSNGGVLVHFEHRELKRLLEEGTITIDELCCSANDTRQELLQKLMLAACCCHIRHQAKCRNCPHAIEPGSATD